MIFLGAAHLNQGVAPDLDALSHVQTAQEEIAGNVHQNWQGMHHGAVEYDVENVILGRKTHAGLILLHEGQFPERELIKPEHQEKSLHNQELCRKLRVLVRKTFLLSENKLFENKFLACFMEQ